MPGLLRAVHQNIAYLNYHHRLERLPAGKPIPRYYDTPGCLYSLDSKSRPVLW